MVLKRNPKQHVPMEAKKQYTKYLKKVIDFLSRINVPQAEERINDVDFITSQIFPLANDKFKKEYWLYASAEFYCRNEKYYRENEITD